MIKPTTPNKFIALFVLALGLTFLANAQKDSLIFTNGNYVVGEIKSMDRGVITIETPYSDSDFNIEWSGITEIYTTTRFLISLTDGRRYNGTFKSLGNGKLEINDPEKSVITITPDQIVYLKGLDNTFLSRLNANIDLGYSLTRANNQEQFNLNSRLGYLADLWSIDMYYNQLIAKQDDADDIRRQDAGMGFRYFLPKDWYLSTDITFLSSTELALNLRINSKIGAGNYIIHTNHSYWGVGAGVASNIENYNTTADSGTVDRNSWEAYVGTELNLYDIGDFSLFTSATAYPSLTEEGRFRADFRMDAKYENFLIDDFYLRAGITVNYDNQPAIAGRETDYVFSTGFGWSW